MRRCLVFFCLIALFSGVEVGAEPERLAFVQDWVIGGVPVTSIAAADFTGDGEVDLAIARGREIEIFRWDKERTAVARLTGLPAPVTALAAGDVDADLLPELLAGTANAGSVRVLGWNGTEFVRKRDTRYLWSAVASVDVADLDDNGWGDIVAITERGDGFVFTWDGLQFSPIWQGGGKGPLNNLILTDVDGDNIPEILMARRRGSVSVMKWVDGSLVTVWENYPWGAVSYCSAANLDGDGKNSILVATNQQMLYVYKWNGTTYPLDKHISGLNMTFDGIAHADLNGDGREEIVVWGDQGVFVKTLRNGRLENLWEAGFLKGVQKVIALDGRLMVLGREGDVRSFVPVGPDYLKLIVRGKEIKVNKVVWRDGNLLLPLDLLAREFNLDIIYGRERWGAAIFQGLNGIIVQEGEATINVDGESVPIETAPAVEQGIIYVPLEVVRRLGRSVEFDEASRSLKIE